MGITPPPDHPLLSRLASFFGSHPGAALAILGVAAFSINRLAIAIVLRGFRVTPEEIGLDYFKTISALIGNPLMVLSFAVAAGCGWWITENARKNGPPEGPGSLIAAGIMVAALGWPFVAAGASPTCSSGSLFFLRSELSDFTIDELGPISAEAQLSYLGTGPDHAVFIRCIDNEPVEVIRVTGEYDLRSNFEPRA